jgi:hypothetical protein
MFSVGPLDITASVSGTAGNGIPVHHRGAEHVVEVSNLLTIPVDLELTGAFTANLLVFSSGATWSKAFNGIPAFVRGSPPPPTKVTEGLLRPTNVGNGTETVQCPQARHRNTGAPGWLPWQFPASGNTTSVNVPP